MLRAVNVVELPAAQRPEQGDKSGHAQEQGGGNEEDKHVHDPPHAVRGAGRSGKGADAASAICFGIAGAGKQGRARARKAFSETTSDEPDMARAAISGVSHPAAASGMATTL